MFKPKKLIALLLVGMALSACKKEVVTANYGIIPLPQSVEEIEGSASFILDNSTVIVYPAENEGLKRTADFLSDYLKISTGLSIETASEEPKGKCIVLSSDYKNENQEAYKLIVLTEKVTISGASDAGVFYGIQTLRKSVPANSEGKFIEFPTVEITDYPRFGYRGAMLDVGRHFFPVDFIKKYIDILALHNVNRFHWHLSEDQGWRIEIKKHPRLTEIGAFRNGTVLGKNSGEYDGETYGGFYTQEEAKSIVAYAAERYITVIPEIDLPGHMLAVLTTYPELGCTGGPYSVAREWGVFDDVFCMGNEKTFEFLEDIFSELIEIFPSKYIHVGGDECPKVRWKACPKCQAKIKGLGLKADRGHSAEDKLQSYCISRIEIFLNSKGREIIGWDEILEGGLAPNATVMSWRGIDGGIAAAKLNHNVIMAPTTHMYFDYFQTDRLDREPLGIGGFIPLEKVYNFEPIPSVLTEDQRKYIIGVQSNMWTEYIPQSSRVEFQLLPRLAALSEVQWTEPSKKDYANFESRIDALLKHYDELGYNYAKYIYDIKSKIVSNAEKGLVEVELSTFDNAPIYYTLDDMIPNREDILYTSPIEIKETATLRAVVFRDGNESEEVYTEKFSISKSTFKPIKADSQPNKKYTFAGLPALVDGLKGGEVYGDSKWLGFDEKDKVAFTIDLQEVTDVSSVKVGTIVSTSDWIFGATGLVVELSEDGNRYIEVARQSYFEYPKGKPGSRINIDAAFPTMNARYVKVIVAKTRVIPEWHPGKGKSPFIFMDEIEVD